MLKTGVQLSSQRYDIMAAASQTFTWQTDMIGQNPERHSVIIICGLVLMTYFSERYAENYAKSNNSGGNCTKKQILAVVFLTLGLFTLLSV